MKIGISFLPPSGAVSTFSSGRVQTSIRLGEVMRQLGHEVVLVSLGGERWFSDCLGEKEEWSVSLLSEVVVSLPLGETATKPEPFDLFIDTYGNIQGALRQQLGRRVVLMCREEMTMALRESTIYNTDCHLFTFDGVDCVWTWRAADVELLRVLSKKPVRVVPFYWSPWHLDGCEASDEYGETWRVYLMENNTRINSTCIPSLMLCEDLIKDGDGSVEKVYVLNADRLVESDYFKTNVKGSLTEGYYEFIGRLRTCDIALNERTCVLSHLRFDDQVPKQALLDLVWLGVPVIHNSRWLRDFGFGYESLYYEGSSVGEAFGKLCSGWQASSERKFALSARFSSLDVAAWDSILSFKKEVAKGAVVVPKQKPFVIQFSDFWADFNPDYNFFTLLFTEALLGMRKVVGVGEGFIGAQPADLVVCGPYSERWRRLDPMIPKICFTGELTQPVYGDGIFLNIGFFQNGYGFANTGVNYCRFPLWAASINWFGADNSRLVNPTLIDIDDCLAEHPGVCDRQKFCAFVVSNPTCQVRNEAFKTLHAYKHVDSAGALFNNMGNGLFAGLGGGGGERRKVEYMRNYKFALVYENSSWSGYTTEKLFHAKVAGCLPLYWGDPIAAQDFHPFGYVNLTGKEGQLLDIVQKLEEDPELLEKKAREPALSVEKIDELRGVMAAIVKYTMDNVSPSEKELWRQLPRALGARSTAEACGLAQRRFACGAEVGPLVVEPEMTEEFGRKVRDMVFVTSASEADMGDLYLWLSHTNSIAVSTKAEFRLYWTGSAESRRLEYIKEEYDWIRIICVDRFSLEEVACRENRLICYMSPCAVLIGNPFYMCAVADQKGACLLKYRDRLVEDGSAAPMDDVVIVRGGSATFGSSEKQRIYADNFVGFASLEEAQEAGRSFYCWSGTEGFKYKQPFLPGITDCSIINLRRRPDRLMRFQKEQGRIKEKIKIVDAVDGRLLRLTPEIQRLFQDNTFGWKKGVIGCNLSHLSIWYELAHSNQFIENMLILEDDVKFSKGWEAKLAEAMKHAPADYDVLYLGGVLPPNKKGWEVCHELVNPHWAKIKENTWFGQEEPSAYFHFCAYSYVLSKRGAEKILDGIKQDNGYKRVSDHQILNPINNMNVYIINPLIAGCYQEEDPIYVNTNFNAINKEHKFDSDLWANTECFTVTSDVDLPLNIEKAIASLKESCNEAAAGDSEQFATVSPQIVFLSNNATDMYEKEWLQSVMEIPASAWENSIVLDDPNMAEEVLSDKSRTLLVVYREVSEGEVTQLLSICNLAHKYNKRIIVVHLSDEHRKNDIGFYENPSIKLIVRNYIRADIPTKIRSKVITLPLGYYRRVAQVPSLEDRTLRWSFHGTSWFNRKKMIEVLRSVEPYSLHVRETYESAGTVEEVYITDMMNSVIVPCPEGNNAESFRIYEALEAGCMPLLVDEGRNAEFYQWIQAALPSIVIVRSWEDSLRLFKLLEENPAAFIERHRALADEWRRWKAHLRSVVKKYVFWA